MRSSLDKLLLGGLEFLKCKTYIGTNRVSLFFFKILYCIVAMISLLGRVLEVIEKLRPFPRRLVSIWVNCLEDILRTHFFLSVILVALLCVTLFLLINSLNFRICLFFVNSNDFLYEFEPDDGRSIFQNVAYLNILVHDVINLLYQLKLLSLEI